MLTYSNCSFQEGQHYGKLVGRLIYMNIVLTWCNFNWKVMSWSCRGDASFGKIPDACDTRPWLVKCYRLFCTKELSWEPKRKLPSQMCEIAMSIQVPCCSWLLNFEYQLYIDVIFPSVFHNFKIFPPKNICWRYWGFNCQLLPPICFKNHNHHHPPKPPQLTPPPWHHRWPMVTRSSASSTSADSVRKCRFSETNSSPRWTQPWSLRHVLGKIQDGWMEAAGCRW